MLLNVFFFVRIYTLSSSFGTPWPKLCCWCEDEDEAHSIELKLLLMLILRFVVLLLCLADSLSTSVNNGARKHDWRRRETTLSGGEESSCKSKKIKILALFCSFFLVSKALLSVNRELRVYENIQQKLFKASKVHFSVLCESTSFIIHKYPIWKIDVIFSHFPLSGWHSHSIKERRACL